MTEKIADVVHEKRTLVVGASTNPARYSYTAVNKLLDKGHIPIPLGLREGKISDVHILTGMPKLEDIDTVTMYIGAQHQPQMYDYILRFKPKRIIFNPGTENTSFAIMAKNADIEVLNACTLVLLATGEF